MYSNNKLIRDVAGVAAQIMSGQQKIDEKLHPNQQKLDVHEPEKDKLTADDFKKLRAEKKPAEVKKEDVELVKEYESKDGRFVHKARPGVYGGSAPEKHVVDTLQGPKKSELEKIEAEKKKKKFSEMVDLYKNQGLKSLSEMIKEEPDNEQFTQEVKTAQEKSEGKGKKAEVAKAAVQAVKNEETETIEIEVLDADEINGVEEITIDERTLTEPEMKKKEEIVKSMKKGMAGFKERYGSRASDVMYATATARAKGE
jgi:hypothetical protein